MVFASGVDHAEQMTEMFRRRGVSVACVTGDTPDRERIIDDFKARRLRCLVNVDVLTTGFNAPHVDLVALARATESAALYVQIVGRGMRTAPGKVDCLLLDYGGNVLRHGPVDAIRVKDKDPNAPPGEPPARRCSECDGICHAGLSECPYCGHEFPSPDRTQGVTEDAYDGAVLRGQEERPRELSVARVRYHRHEKPGKPPSVRVEYQCGLHVHSEWICPEHDGYARRKYLDWCRSVGVSPCETVNAHVGSEPPGVASITVKQGEKYAEIIRRTLRRDPA